MRTLKVTNIFREFENIKHTTASGVGRAGVGGLFGIRQVAGRVEAHQQWPRPARPRPHPRHLCTLLHAHPPQWGHCAHAQETKCSGKLLSIFVHR